MVDLFRRYRAKSLTRPRRGAALPGLGGEQYNQLGREALIC